MGDGYFLQSTLTCFKPPIFQTITFRIDTGCDITTLSLNDALNMKLDISKLGRAPDALGGSEKIPTRRLCDCFLAFYFENCIFVEKIPLIHVSCPEFTEKNDKLIKMIPSLLGMVVIQRYSMRFDDSHVYLER
jgi:hypothetical protein